MAFTEALNLRCHISIALFTIALFRIASIYTVDSPEPELLLERVLRRSAGEVRRAGQSVEGTDSAGEQRQRRRWRRRVRFGRNQCSERVVRYCARSRFSGVSPIDKDERRRFASIRAAREGYDRCPIINDTNRRGRSEGWKAQRKPHILERHSRH